MNSKNIGKYELINAAEKLFSSKGFYGTSTREIAKEANINQSMISYFFSSKENLYAYILDKADKNLETIIQKSSDQATPLQKLTRYIELIVSYLCGKKDLVYIFCRENLSAISTVGSGIMQKLYNKNFDYFNRVIQDGQSNKVFKIEANPHFLFHLTMGTINHFFYTSIYFEDVECAAYKKKIQNMQKQILCILNKELTGNQVAV